VAQADGAARRVADVGLLCLASREQIGDEVVAGAPQGRLHEGRREATAEAIGVDARELALRRVEVVAEVVDVGVQPQGLAASEQVAVGVIRADAGAIDGGVARRDADEVVVALGHIDEDRQVAGWIEGLALADADRPQRLDLGHGATNVGHGLGRIRVARFGIDE